MKLLIALTVLLVAASTVKAIELTENVSLEEVESLMTQLEEHSKETADEEIMGTGTWVVTGRPREIQALRSSSYGSSVRYYKKGFHSAQAAA